MGLLIKCGEITNRIYKVTDEFATVKLKTFTHELRLSNFVAHLMHLFLFSITWECVVFV